MNQIVDHRKEVSGWTFQGTPKPRRMHQIYLAVVELVAMTPARPPRVDEYPYQGGGGRGFTFFGPLKESYFMADVYEENLDGSPANETKIILASCKPYDREAVCFLLTQLIGPEIPETGGHFYL